MDKLSPEGRGMGAVNTIIVKHSDTGQRHLRGENTDWKGTRACRIDDDVEQIIDSKHGLVLGAGGAARAACYALQSLGTLQISIVNRTERRSEAMASLFPDIKLIMYESLDEASEASEVVKQQPLQAIVACAGGRSHRGHHTTGLVLNVRCWDSCGDGLPPDTNGNDEISRQSPGMEDLQWHRRAQTASIRAVRTWDGAGYTQVDYACHHAGGTATTPGLTALSCGV